MTGVDVAAIRTRAVLALLDTLQQVKALADQQRANNLRWDRLRAALVAPDNHNKETTP